MSIPPNSPCRGCASNFAQPVTAQNVTAAQHLVDTVHNVNCVRRNPPLAGIRYRIGDFDSDVTRHVIRWDTRSYDDIIVNGFQAWPQEGTPNATYYDLYAFVQNSGQPLDPDRRARHGFVSTTIDLSWLPDLSTSTVPVGREIRIYRYEIYAPGGIWVASTLCNQYQYDSQAEVCFVAGIAPQYIRAAQSFNAIREAGSRHARITRENEVLIINAHFSPLSHPNMDQLIIQRPIHYYQKKNSKTHWSLNHQIYPPPPPMRRKRQVSNNNWEAALKWYGNDVADVSSYINAAFRSSRTNEAYIFMKNEYVCLNYAPHSTKDRIMNGPLLICDGFPSLIGTPFGEYGIDCAFDTDRNEAFIFSTNLCAHIDYAPRTTDDKILSGPMTITSMFPFFHGTVFENGVDAAFRSTKNKEAYLFRGDKYAVLNYNSKTLTNIQKITDGFPSLLGTVFAISGIDAAFASHSWNEAYIFKGEYYALINFAPHNDYMIDGRVKPILPNWPSLHSILPRKNGGLDVYHYQNHGQHHPGHDELGK